MPDVHFTQETLGTHSEWKDHCHHQGRRDRIVLLGDAFVDRKRTLGDERSRMIRYVPSFFGTTPRGEQCNVSKGGETKGPAVCPRCSSFTMAAITGAGLLRADNKLLGLVAQNKPSKPMSNPDRKPSSTNSTTSATGMPLVNNVPKFLPEWAELHLTGRQWTSISVKCAWGTPREGEGQNRPCTGARSDTPRCCNAHC